eukprot:4114611-Pyramimonas_sp.AAC.1
MGLDGRMFLPFSDSRGPSWTPARSKRLRLKSWSFRKPQGPRPVFLRPRFVHDEGDVVFSKEAGRIPNLSAPFWVSSERPRGHGGVPGRNSGA